MQLDSLNLSDSLAIEAFTSAVEQSEENQTSLWLLRLGTLLNEDYQYEQADAILGRALKNAQDSSIISDICYQTGLSLMYRDIRLKSLKCFKDAFTGYRRVGDSLRMGMALDKIADNYNYIGDHAQARPYYNQCLEIFTAIKDTSRLTNVLGNIGGMLSEEQQNDSSLYFYQKARILNEQVGNLYNLSSDLSGIGIALEELGRTTEALDYFKRSYDVALQDGNEEGIAFANQHLGYYYFREGNYDSAQHYMEVANGYGKKMNYAQLLINTLDVLHQIAYRKGAYKRAYLLYMESHELEDSLLSLENVSLINSLSSEYAIEKREADNQTLINQATIREEYIEQQARLNTLLIVGGLLLILAIAALLGLNHNRQKKNKTIKADRDLIRVQSEKLQELNTYKSTFFANIAHDFRAPISLIIGFVDLIKTTDNRLQADTRKYLQYIQETTERLNKMTWEINQLIQIEENRYQLTYVDVNINDFFGTIGKIFKSGNRNSEITFSFQSHIPDHQLITADKAALEKIIFNLVGNAFKYNTTGTKISLLITLKDQALVIRVTDDGPGILPEKLDRIFERYYRTEKGAKSASGLGIGLSLAKELVTLHGGTLGVESIPNEKTCFTAQLPIQPNQARITPIAIEPS